MLGGPICDEPANRPVPKARNRNLPYPYSAPTPSTFTLLPTPGVRAGRGELRSPAENLEGRWGEKSASTNKGCECTMQVSAVLDGC